LANRILNHRQQGAAMVEFSVTVLIFFVLVFAIFEFSLLMMNVARTNEVTRDLARIAIVHDPVCDIFNGGCPSGGLACPGGAEVTVRLNEVDTSCGNTPETTGCLMLTAAQRQITAIEASQVEVVYACSAAGAENRPQLIPLVTVGLTDVRYSLIVPELLGLPAEITMPDFDTSRLGEDMYMEHQ
jgi:hypothetical protein